MSTKFDRIFKISKVKNATDIEKQVLSALIGCLDGPETCEFLLKTIEGKSTLRDLVLRKINHDISTGQSNEYKKLAEDLIALAGAPKYSVANSAATCLSQLLEGNDGEYLEDIVEFFLSSERKSFRNRAWKSLTENYSESYNKLVWQAWERYEDKKALRVIVLNISPSKLYSHREKIVSAIEHGSLVAQLYMRLYKIDEKVVEELFKYSISTYLYCLVKLGLNVPEQRKSKISPQADNLGLVLWCLGRLAEWDIIEQIYADTVPNSM